jgi:Tn3 transposase DDE domain
MFESFSTSRPPRLRPGPLSKTNPSAREPTLALPPLVSPTPKIKSLNLLRDRTYENQRHRASGLNLVVAAIILWNTVYLNRST